MTTTVSITLVLLLLGATVLVGFMGKRISSLIKENLVITVEIPDKMGETEVLALQNKLKQNAFVKQLTYVSKEEIKKQLIVDLGRDPEEVLGYNPASSCFELKLKADYANSDSIKLIEKKLKNQKIGQNIIYSQDDLDLVNANLSKIGTVMLFLALILTLISFTLIRNTVRLNIYSKRFLINTMQLVGATNSFIKRPFIKQMIVYGLLAATLANALITAILYYFAKEYSEVLAIIRREDLLLVYAIVFLLGVLLTFTTTYFAMNKYLKMQTNKLYYI